MYFTKVTVGCKSKSKPLGEKIELFSPCCLTPLLTPHVLAPPRADHDEVTIGGRYLGTLPESHHNLPFIRENNPVITDRPHPADSNVISEQWTQDSVIKVASSGAMRSHESTQQTTDLRHKQQRAGQGEKGVSQPTGFLDLLDFFWFYVGWTRTWPLNIYVHPGAFYFPAVFWITYRWLEITPYWHVDMLSLTLTGLLSSSAVFSGNHSLPNI